MPLVSRTFDQLIDFTRTSAATYVDATGKIVPTAASRNLLTFTQEFDNGGWSKANATVAANSTTAPDGTLTADTCTPDTTSAAHLFFQSATVAGSNVQSIYVKANGYTKVGLRESQTGAYYAAFDLATGTVLATSSATATITAVGDGWYRLAMVGTLTGTTRMSLYVLDPTYTTGLLTGAWTPNGTSGIFIWGAQLEANTTATDYTRNNGGVYPPRFDYDPVTLAPKGLLVEEQRTNLLTYSEQFDNAAWSKSNVTVTANAATSPDGTVDADAVIPNTTSSTHLIRPASSVSVSGNTGTHSFYVKAAGYSRIGLRETNVTGNWATFNLSSGAVIASSGVTNVGITAVGNGWYRIVATDVAATQRLAVYVMDNSYTSGDPDLYAYSGDGTSGIFIWGAQLEAGAFATSYIPTVASQVTRTADVATITGANFSQWYNQSEGTFVVDFDVVSTAPTTKTPFTASDGTSNNMSINYASAANIFLDVRSGGVAQATFNVGAATANIPFKSAIAYRANDFAASGNGAAAVTDTSGSVPANQSELNLGYSRNYGGLYLNGHIRSLRFYPTRLSNAQLQALTA